MLLVCFLEFRLMSNITLKLSVFNIQYSGAVITEIVLQIQTSFFFPRCTIFKRVPQVISEKVTNFFSINNLHSKLIQ
jgi:hypothetical protein